MKMLLILLAFIMLFTNCKSIVILDVGNLQAKKSNQVKVFLTYAPKNPIAFISKKWNIIGGYFTPEEKVIRLKIKKQGENKFSFFIKPKLVGISAYKLISLSINCQLDQQKVVSFHSDITFNNFKSNQIAWIEGSAYGMGENNAIARVIKIESSNTRICIRDDSKTAWFSFYERYENGNLMLDEENRPILLADSIPSIEKLLGRKLNWK